MGAHQALFAPAKADGLLSRQEEMQVAMRFLLRGAFLR